MMNRLISQNKFTRKYIKEVTGNVVERPIVVVGNTIQRRNIEKLILEGKSVAIIGAPCSGKLTAVLDICDRHGLDFHISYDGSGFGDAPFRRNSLYIIRYSDYNAIFKRYLESSQIIFLATDDLAPSLTPLVTVFHFHKPTLFDKQEYERLKGEPMNIFNTYASEEQNLLGLTSKLITGTLPPEEYNIECEKIAAFNFQRTDLLQVCALANKTNNPLYRWGIMNLIRFSRPMEYKYPPRLAKHDSELYGDNDSDLGSSQEDEDTEYL